MIHNTLHLSRIFESFDGRFVDYLRTIDDKELASATPERLADMYIGRNRLDFVGISLIQSRQPEIDDASMTLMIFVDPGSEATLILLQKSCPYPEGFRYDMDFDLSRLRVDATEGEIGYPIAAVTTAEITRIKDHLLRYVDAVNKQIERQAPTIRPKLLESAGRIISISKARLAAKDAAANAAGVRIVTRGIGDRQRV